MGATVTPIQGYLAGIFRTPGSLVGAVTKHQLMLNPDFEVGALTNWTDDTAGTATVAATAAKGWMDRSWGVVMTDAGDGKCGISQIVTLDNTITATEALSYRIHASVWAKFDATAKTATLKVSGSSTGSVSTVNGVPTAGGTGYSVDDILTVSAGSGDATVKVTAETGGVIDTIVFLSSGTSGYTVAAGLATTGGNADATIEITAIADKVLGTGNVTLLSEHPFYGDTEWAYFSIDIAVLEYMEKVTLEVYSEAGAAQVWNIDNVQAYIVDEIAGAFGDLVQNFEVAYEGISTYATIGSHGERVFHPTAEEPSTIEVPAYYIASESFGPEMVAGTKVFVVLYTKRGTKTEDRWEFFAYPKGINFSSPIGEIMKETASLQVTGLIGYADR